MNDTVDRITTFGTESTRTFLDTAFRMQQQNVQLVQTWLNLIEASRQSSREIATKFVKQAQTAGSTWQQFAQESVQAVQPAAVQTQAQQMQEAIETLTALDNQVIAHAKRAEAAAKKAQTALDALAAVNEQVTAGAKRAETAAQRAQRASHGAEAVSEQVNESVKRAEAAARRAQRVTDAPEATAPQAGTAAGAAATAPQTGAAASTTATSPKETAAKASNATEKTADRKATADTAKDAAK
ncbi:MAG: hypothetical protein NVS4B2_21180 [Chloroflexota bacterium]